MTTGAAHTGDAPWVHFKPSAEPFAKAAQQKLAAAPLSPPGICRNPHCSRPFAPAREWQVYCSDACRRHDERAFHRVGQCAAPALLAWQMGRYAKTGPLADLSRAGRTYYSAVAAEWLRSRRDTAKRAGGEG